MDEGVRKALEEAVDWEAKSYDFYKRASEKVSDSGIKSLLLKLASEELKHKRALEEVDSDFRPGLCGSDWFDVIDRFDEHRMRSLKLASKVLLFAIDKEEKAKKKYAGFAKTAKDQKVRKLFDYLSVEESCHESLLRAEYGRLNKK